METKVTVSKRYVKDGSIEMSINTDNYKGTAASVLVTDYFGVIQLSLSIRATEIEYVTPLLEVIKNEYEKLLQDRKEIK